jgi:death on curing protein
LLILTLNAVNDLHEVVIRYGGEKGFNSEGMLKACLERPFTNVYGRNRFRTIFNKAASLLYCIAGPFHPFTDGNKRTGLLVTSFFLLVNGYTFDIPKDSVEFTLSIAKNEIKNIRKISKWLQQSCKKNKVYDYHDETRMLLLNDISVPVYSNIADKITLELEKLQ